MRDIAHILAGHLVEHAAGRWILREIGGTFVAQLLEVADRRRHVADRVAGHVARVVEEELAQRRDRCPTRIGIVADIEQAARPELRGDEIEQRLPRCIADPGIDAVHGDVVACRQREAAPILEAAFDEPDILDAAGARQRGADGNMAGIEVDADEPALGVDGGEQDYGETVAAAEIEIGEGRGGRHRRRDAVDRRDIVEHHRRLVRIETRRVEDIEGDLLRLLWHGGGEWRGDDGLASRKAEGQGRRSKQRRTSSPSGRGRGPSRQ